MSLNDFFARKKGKKVAKPMNLNADGTEVAAEEKKPDSKDAKEWKQEEEEEKPAISPSSKTITQLQSTEETEKEAKTWNAKKASAEAQPTAGGRYMTPFNAPGQVTEGKFPSLQKTTQGQTTAVFEPKKTGGKNAFSGLDLGDDSDDDQDGFQKPALLSKEKGAKVREFGQQEEKEEVDEEAKRKKTEELRKKKADKDAKRRELLGLGGKQKVVDEMETIVVPCDAGKFGFGRFEPGACEEKYVQREKLVSA